MQTTQKLFRSQYRLDGVLSALLLALLLCLPALAQRPGPPPVGKGAFGKISAVSATSITVSFREGGSATFTLAASIPITLDGATTDASALAAGQFAAVTSDDGAAATKIDARTKLGPPPGGGPGMGGPPPGDGPPPDGPPPSN